ncbi:MAG: OmpH family outer membrane protein [Bacteroidota bacterium]
MNKLILAISMFTAVLLTSELKAQKFGYVNSQELLLAMPETKKMDTLLSKRSDEYQLQIQKMYQEYQLKTDDYQKKVASGNMSPLIKEATEKELSSMENNIKDFQQKAEDELDKYQSQLIAPIQEKALNAIKTVAKTAGYTYIFDDSSGALLYKPDGDNITTLVKKQLGI